MYPYRTDIAKSQAPRPFGPAACGRLCDGLPRYLARIFQP